MIDLLVRGNLTFTLPLLATAIAVLGAAGRAALLRTGERDGYAFWTRLVFQLGLFGFVFGLFSQAISFYQMMSAIEQAGGVSPALMAGGLKVSLICPVFGVGIFALALLLWLGLSVLAPDAEQMGT